MLIHNFLFIHKFVEKTKSILKDSRLKALYANLNNELVIDFGDEGHLRFIFFNGTCVFAYFPSIYTINKETKPRFRTLWDTGLKSIEANNFDRSFIFKFKEGSSLVVMLYGRRSNILYYEPEKELPKEVFRYNILADKERKLNEFTKLTPPKIELNTPLSILQFIPKEIADIFPEQKVSSIEDLSFWVKKISSNLEWNLNLKNKEPIISVCLSDYKTDILQTLRDYYIHYSTFERFEEQKSILVKTAQNELKKKSAALIASKKRLDELVTQRSPKEVADLIMAYLHLFENRKSEVLVEDFYTGGSTLIKLPNNTSAIKHAEKLYKKSGGVKHEIELTKSKISLLESQVLKLESEVNEIEKTNHSKELKQIDKSKTKEKAAESLPYSEYLVEGHTIRIGKNAKSNDEMLRSFTHKNDYWLHAKDYAGSHVIIKRDNRPNPIPEKIILLAASWAAWFSKGKNQDTLPVIVTERKHVRKNKQLRAGQVIVDKEKVVLVRPEKPS